MHTYIHTYIHTYTYVYAHTHTGTAHELDAPRAGFQPPPAGLSPKVFATHTHTHTHTHTRATGLESLVHRMSLWLGRK